VSAQAEREGRKNSSGALNNMLLNEEIGYV